MTYTSLYLCKGDPASSRDVNGPRLAVFRSNIFHTCNECFDLFGTIFQVDTLSGRRLMHQAHPLPSIDTRPDRPRHETAIAVRTDVMQNRLDACRTERALVCANSGFHRRGRQILVAILTIGTKFKHGYTLY